MPKVTSLTSTCRRAAHVSEEISVGIPKNAIEAEHNLIEIPKSQPFDGLLFPVRQWRVELDCVTLL